ncbi:MAG: hypothetical protein WBC13_10710, partial [Dokdonella sp.]
PQRTGVDGRLGAGTIKFGLLMKSINTGSTVRRETGNAVSAVESGLMVPLMQSGNVVGES